MTKYLVLFCFYSLGLSSFASEYKGCSDIRYKEYVDNRLAFYTELEKQRYVEQQEKIANRPLLELSYFEKRRYFNESIILNAQFGSPDWAIESINAYKELRFPGWPMGETGDRKHQIYIAKGWLSLREGKEQEAIRYLLEAANTKASPILASFGPDKSLIRQLYRQGHSAAVLEYLDRVEIFWNTEHALEYLSLWRKMIEHDCPIQFQFYDKTSTAGFGF